MNDHNIVADWYTDDVKQSEQRIISIMRSFREELLAGLGVINGFRKADHTLATELDATIERTIREVVSSEFPQFGILGEELGADIRDGQAFWSIDPIDGTASYIRGIYGVTSMAAFIVDGLPMVSILYDFEKDTIYQAYRDNGAYRNGERLRCNDRPVRESAVYVQNLYVLREPWIQQLFAEGVQVYRPFGASGMAYILLASGQIDGFFVIHASVKIHDNAPGTLLAREAGAHTITRDGADEWTTADSAFIVATPTVTRYVAPLLTATHPLSVVTSSDG